MRNVITCVLACLLFAGDPAYGWWETGHRTVARIAAAHLTASTRTRVARILNVDDNPQAVADALSKASTWADDTKAETKTGEWHYIDITLQDSRAEMPERCKADGCVTARIRIFATQLGRGATGASTWSDLDALRFLVHFIGDVHQPMHAVSDGDLGGNCERLQPPVGRAKNLHALWDGEIVNALDANDNELAATLDDAIRSIPIHRQASLSQGTESDWAWESHELAQKNIYGRLHIPLAPVVFPSNCDSAPANISHFQPVVDTVYIDDMKPVVATQLEKAGLRLARVLNERL